MARWIRIRTLAALDIELHGLRFVLWEFGIGVLLPLALGVISLVRGLGWASRLLGLYLLSLSLNYLPLFAHAVSLASRKEQVLANAVDTLQLGRKY